MTLFKYPGKKDMFSRRHQDFENRFVGVDRDFGEVTVERCKRTIWLHYLMECESLTSAGRWFRRVITPEIAASVKQTAKEVLERLDWYFAVERFQYR